MILKSIISIPQAVEAFEAPLLSRCWRSRRCIQQKSLPFCGPLWLGSPHPQPLAAGTLEHGGMVGPSVGCFMMCPTRRARRDPKGLGDPTNLLQVLQSPTDVNADVNAEECRRCQRTLRLFIKHLQITRVSIDIFIDVLYRSDLCISLLFEPWCIP